MTTWQLPQQLGIVPLCVHGACHGGAWDSVDHGDIERIAFGGVLCFVADLDCDNKKSFMFCERGTIRKFKLLQTVLQS